MMLSRLGVSNAYLTYDIFNLQCVYWDVTPLQVEEDLYLCLSFLSAMFCSFHCTCFSPSWLIPKYFIPLDAIVNELFS